MYSTTIVHVWSFNNLVRNTSAKLSLTQWNRHPATPWVYAHFFRLFFTEVPFTSKRLFDGARNISCRCRMCRSTRAFGAFCRMRRSARAFGGFWEVPFPFVSFPFHLTLTPRSDSPSLSELFLSESISESLLSGGPLFWRSISGDTERSWSLLVWRAKPITVSPRFAL